MEQKTQRSAGMEDILAAFPDRETFDRYWEENYVPVTYEDVKEAFEDFVTSAGGHIFLSDYEEGGCISKEDFKDNLSQLFERPKTVKWYCRKCGHLIIKPHQMM